MDTYENRRIGPNTRLAMTAAVAVLWAAAGALQAQAGRISNQINDTPILLPQQGPAQSVPESGSTALLLATAIGGLIIWRRKARSAPILVS
jgi:hypothetical protein